jgi:hypothetical protein
MVDPPLLWSCGEASPVGTPALQWGSLSGLRRTAEAHVSAFQRMLQLSDRHELSRWAVERRLVN